MRPLWASCMALWASCIIFSGAAADTFVPLTRDETVVRLVLQESNGEPFYGLIAVAGSVFDRMDNSRWPSTADEVARQPRQYDGMHIPLKNYSPEQIELARSAVYLASIGARPCGTVYWFHATYVSPYWKSSYRRACTIGRHIFYTDPVKG